MQSGLILSQQDIKKIIAEHFHVSEDKVIVSNFFIFRLTQKRPKNDYKTKGQKRHEYLHNN